MTRQQWLGLFAKALRVWQCRHSSSRAKLLAIAVFQAVEDEIGQQSRRPEASRVKICQT